MTAEGEFDLIRRLASVSQTANQRAAFPAALGIGDDAALLGVDPALQLVVTTDTLVSGVHFDDDVDPADLGYKSLAVNMSDLAAMGAQPAWHLLNITGPKRAGDREGNWLDRFAAGMGELAAAVGSQLVGGDTTGGPLSITVTALGLVPRGQALLRNSARPGDLVVVSGVPGLAACALTDSQKADDAARRHLLRPEPRLALGRALRGRATACIDISDGLAADLGHILESSGLGGELWLERLPYASSFDGLDAGELWNLQLGGGDDYELCFTLPPEDVNDLTGLAVAGGVGLKVVGRLEAGSSLRCLRTDGREFKPARHGWNHFAR